MIQLCIEHGETDLFEEGREVGEIQPAGRMPAPGTEGLILGTKYSLNLLCL